MADDDLADNSLDELLALTEDALAVGGSSRSPGARSADLASPASRGLTSYSSAPQDPAEAAWAKMQRVYNGQGRSWGDTVKRQGDWAVARRETHSESSASVSTSLYFLPTWTSTGTKAVRCTTKYENDHGERGSVICFSSKKPGVVAEVHMGDEPTENFRLLPDGTLEPVDDLTDA